ncbi:MAG: glycosyltransferase [Patescibacteria group bacterium]|jgi:glycosyltransferase involved in cell wall biosynthesis
MITKNKQPVVFHLITCFEIGGAERLLESFLPKLSEFRHIVISLRGDGPMREAYERVGLTTAILNMHFPFSPHAFFKFFKLVKRYHPQVLVTYLIHADLIGRVWGKICGIPNIVSYLVARFRGDRFQNPIRLMVLTNWMVDRYIAVSEEVKRFFVEDINLPARKFTVITCGINPLQFFTHADKSKRNFFLQEIDLPVDAMIIGTVSKLRPEKGVERFLNALPIVIKSSPKVYAIFIGGGVLKSQMEQLAAKLEITNHVRFLGDRNDVPSILPMIDVFVIASYFEGMSVALLEAMAAERAVLITDTIENREVITIETGRLIDTANEEKFSKAIVELLNNESLRKKMGAAARQRVNNYFSVDQGVAKLSRFFKELI